MHLTLKSSLQPTLSMRGLTVSSARSRHERWSHLTSTLGWVSGRSALVRCRRARPLAPLDTFQTVHLLSTSCFISVGGTKSLTAEARGTEAVAACSPADRSSPGSTPCPGRGAESPSRGPTRRSCRPPLLPSWNGFDWAEEEGGIDQTVGEGWMV